MARAVRRVALAGAISSRVSARPSPTSSSSPIGESSAVPARRLVGEDGQETVHSSCRLRARAAPRLAEIGHVRKAPDPSAPACHDDGVIDDFERCYRFMRSRDPRYDGFFFVGVTSTGIYCRPSCPARAARPAQRPPVRDRRRRADRRLPRLQALRARRRARLAGVEPARRRGRARVPADRRRDRRPRGRAGSRLPAGLQRAPAQPHPRGGGGRRSRAARPRAARAGGAHADRVDRPVVRRGGAGVGLRQHPPVQRHDPRDLRAHAERAAPARAAPARRDHAGRGGAAPARPRAARRRGAAGLPGGARDRRASRRSRAAPTAARSRSSTAAGWSR